MRFAGQINALRRPKLNAAEWPKTMRLTGQIRAPHRPKTMRICTKLYCGLANAGANLAAAHTQTFGGSRRGGMDGRWAEGSFTLNVGEQM